MVSRDTTTPLPFLEAEGTLRTILLLSVCAVPLLGCSAPEPVVLQNPDTKQTVQCAADPWAVWQWDMAAQNDDCARKYEQAGFQRLQ